MSRYTITLTLDLEEGRIHEATPEKWAWHEMLDLEGDRIVSVCSQKHPELPVDNDCLHTRITTLTALLAAKSNELGADQEVEATSLMHLAHELVVAQAERRLRKRLT